MTAWNRRLQAASRYGTSNQQAEDTPVTLPADLHPDDRAAAEALVTVAKARKEFEASLLVRHAGEDEPSLRLAVRSGGGMLETELSDVVHRTDVDQLTNLPTRSLFLAEVDRSLRSTERNGRVVALLYLDVDDFKSINDAVGFDAGDEALRILARELRSAIRPSDLLARISGDEFAVLCGDLYAPSEAKDLAERLRVSISRTDLGAAVNRGVTTSIGVAIGDYRDQPDVLLGDADTALQHAKVRGRDRWELFTPSLRNRTDRRLAIAARLHEVLDADGVNLAYQPIVEIGTGEVTGFEALIRDHLVEGATVAPRELIAAADDVGLIRRVESSVLRTACRRLGEWTRGELDTSSVLHVNVTRHRLTDHEFP